MNRHDVPRTLRSTLIPALTLGVAAALASAAPSRAQLPSPLELHAEIHDGVLDLLRVLDRVPERIERHHRRHLEVFFGGNQYDRYHRHEHATYHFPVWVDGDVAYRPYTYCGDRLILSAGAYRPNLWQYWGRESHGSWCGHHRGYYPTSHSCFRPAYVAPRPVHRHDRWCGHRVEHRHDRWCGHRVDRYDRYDRHDRHDRYDRREHRDDRRGWGRGHRHDRSCNHGRGHGDHD